VLTARPASITIWSAADVTVGKTIGSAEVMVTGGVLTGSAGATLKLSSRSTAVVATTPTVRVVTVLVLPPGGGGVVMVCDMVGTAQVKVPALGSTVPTTTVSCGSGKVNWPEFSSSFKAA
jgi:hypothetical protein